MSIVQTINLNLIPNSEPILVKCDQYDVGEGRIVAKLYDGDMAYTPGSGATAIIQGKKPDGHGFMYEATLTGNTVTADLTNQMSVAAGRVFVQFVITESDNRTGTFVFFLDVQPSALPADTEMSTSEYQVIEELLETAQAINENFPYIGANGHWFYYDVEQGQYVDSGVAAGTSISIGTTTTLDAGDDATVTNTGDNINAVFNFGIPRGPKGDQGNPGATGPQGPQGEQGEKGEKGDTGNTGATPNISMSATADGTSSATPTVNVSKTGTAENPNFALAFSGLKGNQGEQGPQGETGATGATGNGIASITKTGTVGLVDTYTILFTNGQTTTFTVTNGQDGTGSGDMTKAVYDSTNAVADAGGIVSYINGLDFDKYLALYGATSLGTTADLDDVTNLGTYYKATTTAKKAGEPSNLVAADKYTLIVMGAMMGDTPQTGQVDPVAQILVAYIDNTHETKIYVRGFAGYTGSVLFTPHWTTWKSLDSPDVSGKADKVSGATNGDFAGLDSNGNLTDSGYKPSDFATPSDIPDVTGKADKVSGAISGDLAGLDANGNLTDSGSKAADFAAAGAALPTGGTTGQAIVKHSNTDYDTEWGDVLSLEQAREAEVVPSKSIFNFNTITSDSNNGITMTVTKNQYGEIEEIDLDGTATASFAFTIKDFTSELLPEGTFVLSDEGGFVEGTYPNSKGAYTYLPRKKGSSGTLNTSIQTANSNHARQFTVDYDEFDYFALQIFIWNGTVLDHLKLRPMICTLADWNVSHTYEPYYVPVKDRVNELEDIKTYTIKNGNTAVSGVSVRKLGRWVFMDLTNVNVGTFLGATIPNEIKPLVGCHFFGIVRDLSATGVQWQGLLDLTTETQVTHIYYTDTYNTVRKKADTTSTNLIISSTAVYLSAI